MSIYGAEIQNVVRTDVDEYLVTFRVYRDSPDGRTRWEDEGAQFELYSMTAMLVSCQFMFTGKDKLGECVKLFRENAAATDLPESDHHKWRIGALANEIMTSLADRGFMEAWYVKEKNEG